MAGGRVSVPGRGPPWYHRGMTLDQVRRHALSLPEAAEAPHHHFGSFRVRGRIFATWPPEGTHLHVFVGEEERERALALEPGWIEKLSWGGKVVGVRITLRPARAALVCGLLDAAWAARAPKALLAARARP
jgi:hypothetical protein